MNLKKQNMEYIHRGFPELYERIKKGIEYKDEVKARYEKTSTSQVLFLETGENARIRMNSLYDPGYEAQVWMDAQEGLDASNIFLLGLGNGEFARALLKRKREKGKVCIYEPSTDSFMKALECCDLREFFMTLGVRIIIKGINDDMASGVMEEMLTLENYDSKTFLISPQYGKLFPMAIKRITRIYMDGVGVLMSNRNSIKRFIEYSPFNQLYNIRYLVKNTVVPYLAKQWNSDVPVLLVGAGPSLKEEVSVLRDIQDKVYIFAVDTALNYLLSQDVIPDFFISIEPYRDMKYFADDRSKNIPMFAKLSTNYELLKRQNAPIIFGYEEELAERIYDKYQIPKSTYRYGGNAATSLFAICKELGTRCVVLVGQDMCYGKYHESHAFDMGESFVEEECFVVKNNQGKEVQSRQDWYRFIKWYENAIPVCAFDHVFNTAKCGARVEGADYLSLQEVVEQYGVSQKKRRIDLEGIKKTFYPHQIDTKKIYSQLKNEVELIDSDNLILQEKEELMIYGILEMYQKAEENLTILQANKKLQNYLKTCMKEIE